ncbi:NADPH-dependent oxidoreductase [Bacillus sp. HNG]|uniref:NADPH-dependent FMN reductase n=1 Tax=Bacillus sp. HNG TaxID=2293325 RepID=UPI000E2F99A3|nr:NAD(P)H-dependent oxidoreductase [Bacillus sp. HNG]RFB12612.1 NADPH-dependent oxidoreductase [Bacillus sp. HNG]
MVKVGIVVGSLRKESVTKKLAVNVADLFPDGYETEFIEIGNLPLYNEDIDNENGAHAEYVTFRNKMKDIDAVLFVTPEYNRSMPASIKNALDVGSRPYGHSVWDGKGAAIISQSPSPLSGFGANHHLRQSLVFLNMQPLQQPEAYIANSWELFDENGKINNEGTVQFLQSVVDAFVELIQKFK